MGWVLWSLQHPGSVEDGSQQDEPLIHLIVRVPHQEEYVGDAAEALPSDQKSAVHRQPLVALFTACVVCLDDEVLRHFHATLFEYAVHDVQHPTSGCTP